LGFVLLGADGKLFVKIEFFVGEVEGSVGEEVLHVAAVFLGGTAQAGGALYKAAYAVHLKDIVLLLGGDILHHLGYKLGAYAVLNGLQNLEGVCYGSLADRYRITFLDGFGWLALYAVYLDAALLAGLGGNGAGLEDTH